MVKKLDELVLNQRTLTQLQTYLASPTHALMLTGAVGAGLGAIAKALGYQLAHNDVIFLTPTQHNKQKTAIINADDIAGLGQILRDKRSSKLAVIIDDADQTASGVFERMLKLIEEPVRGVHYIFTTHNLSQIPTTILSRSSLIKVGLPSAADCQALYSSLDAKTKAQVKFLAERQPAEIMRLIDSANDLEAKAHVMDLAKRFIAGKLSTRLELIDQIKDKDEGISLCQSVASLVYLLSSRPNATVSPLTISSELQLLADTVDRLRGNGNLRLQLVNLAVNFGAML